MLGRPELLDSGAGGGAYLPPPPAPPGGGGKKRRGLLVGGGVVGLAAVAGGAFAVYQVAFATGPQPAEALPASTIGYVSIDLDPSGKQKLEALEALEKFPAFNDNVDIKSDDDLRQKLFELAQDEGACADVSWEDDIEPWLGDRFGFAAVDVGEDVSPDTAGIAPVGVIQVKDADEAEAGLEKLRSCAGSEDESTGSFGEDELAPEEESTDEPEESSETGGWAIRGDWVVIAETTEIAEAVSDAAEDEPLSEDEDFEKWTDAAGDPGIVTAYAAPEAGTYLSDAVGFLSLSGPVTCAAVPSPVEPYSEEDPFGEEDPYSDDYSDDYSDYDDGCSEDAGADESTEALGKAFEEFDGAAVTIRFDDGGLEIESASSVDYLGLDKLYASDRGGDAVQDLPEDTAIALGIGFEEGWFTSLTDYLDSISGGALDIEDGLATLEAETGLNLPEDIETLAGESAALAIGGDFDPAQLEDDPSDQPLGLKVTGDPDAITGIIDRLLEDPEIAEEVKDQFGYETDDDHVVAGFDDDWTAQLLDDGGLGDTDTYQDVVAESDDAAAVLFVNFDAGDWLERAVEADGGDPEVLANVKPLEALGFSVWTDDDDVSHSVLKVTTD